MEGNFLDGKCAYPDGKVYEGKWRDGKPWGYGIKNWPDGRKYEGEWADSKPVGRGKKGYPDGSYKTGIWVDGKFVEDKVNNPEIEAQLK
jgi:hypothetical protein